MLFSILELIRSLTFFTTSYSNNVFPEPLSKEEEEKYITLHLHTGNYDFIRLHEIRYCFT